MQGLLRLAYIESNDDEGEIKVTFDMKSEDAHDLLSSYSKKFHYH